MLVKLYLHGHLKSKVQKDFVEVEATTLYDALHSLAFRYQKELKAPLDIGRWRIMIKDYETKESWFVPLYSNEIHVFPTFRTAKSKWVQVGIGVVLMAVAFVTTGPVGSVMTTSIGVGEATVGTMVFTAGLNLTLQGVVNLLTPTPKNDTLSSSTENNSKYLGAQGNTVAAGTRIPFGYGMFKVSGHFISYNVSSTTVVEV